MLRSGRRVFFALLLALASALPVAAQTPPAGGAVDGRVIPLAEALEIARTRNVSLQRSLASEAAQRIQIETVLAQRQPTLSIGSGYQLSSGRTLIENRVATGTAQNANFGLSAGVLVYDGGATALQATQARLALTVAQGTRARAEQTVVYNVIQNYVNLAAQRENVARLREQAAAAEQQLARVNALIAERVRAEADRYTQEADVAQARLAVARAERDAAVAEATIVGLLALDPAGRYTFPAPPLALLDSAAAQQADAGFSALAAQAYGARPDLRALDVQQQAAGTALRLARTGRRPRVTASYSYGSNWSDEYRRLTGFDPVTQQPTYAQVSFVDQLDERRGGGFGVNVSFPIFDNSTTYYSLQRAQVQVQDAALALEEQRQRVNAEIAQALADLRFAPAQVAAAEAQVAAARRAFTAAEDRYRFNVGTLYEVVQARAALVRAEGDLLTVRVTLAAQRATLAYTLGTLDPATLAR